MASASTSQTSLKRSPEKDLLAEVRNFVKGSTYEAKVPRSDIVRSAVVLLKNLPSTRAAVLEYFSNVYDDCISNQLTWQKGEKDEESSAIIDEIQGLLLEFLTTVSSAWAPIISSWSVELLGLLSSKYTEKYAYMSGVSLPASLNETLQMWTSCRATKSLIEITSQCFASMVGDAPDSCVDALLETSVKHSPNFDWVVAHIGSCFPHTIISRVLLCGLRDYTEYSRSMDASMMEQRQPKLTSVVSILSHLASQHGRDIRNAVMKLFYFGVNGDVPAEDRDLYEQSVPFLMHLASRSSPVLGIIAEDIVQALSGEVIMKLFRQSGLWISKGNENIDSLFNMSVHLTTTSENATYRLLQLLINLGYPEGNSATMIQDETISQRVGQSCRIILERTLSDVSRMIQMRQAEAMLEIPFMKGLQPHSFAVCQMLVDASAKRFHILALLVKCLCFTNGEDMTSKMLAHLLIHTKCTKWLGFYRQLEEELELRHHDMLGLVAQNMFHTLDLKWQEGETEEGPEVEFMVHALKNLQAVIKAAPVQGDLAMEQTHMKKYEKLLLRFLESLMKLTSHSCRAVAREAVELICMCTFPDTLEMEWTCRLCHILIAYFLSALKVQDRNIKSTMCSQSSLLLSKICNMRTAQKTCLRLLLQGALSQDFLLVFGGKKPVVINTEPSPRKQEANVSLLSNNRKIDSAGKISTHTGVIGRGVKSMKDSDVFTEDTARDNKQLFFSFLHELCCRNGVQVVIPGADQTIQIMTGKNVPMPVSKTTALILIELVAPDAMYNGIPWPEEDFVKVTIERDLLIKKKFDENPFLWDMFEFVAAAPGGLCFCSAIVRGLAASLIYYWDSCRDAKASSSSKQLEATSKLIGLMRKGRFIPPALADCECLLPHISPYEVLLLLNNLWRFMKENPPIPDVREWSGFTLDPYMDQIHFIIQKNIFALGHLYHCFAD